MAQLLSNLPVGAKVKFGKYSVNGETAQDVTWLIVAKNHTGYPTNSVTLMTERIIDLRCFDAAQPKSSDPRIKDYGLARYAPSNIRQWLNSDKIGGSWYVEKHSNDQAPTEAYVSHSTHYAQRPGFLNAFTTYEKNAILATTIKSQDHADGLIDVTDKVFLASTVEVLNYGGDYLSDTEGDRFEYFVSNHTTATLTEQAYTNSPSTYKPSSITTMGAYLTRSGVNNPNRSSNEVYLISTVTHTPPQAVEPKLGWAGVRPVLNLSNSVLVTDTIDSTGSYITIFNTAPNVPTVLNTPTTIYGGKSNAITWGKATDPEGDTLTYQLECSVNKASFTQIYKGTFTTYGHLVPFGANTVQYRVMAIDPEGASSEYKYTNTLTVVNNNAPVISGSDSNLGVKSEGFTGTYTVTDANNNSVTVTESIDGVQIRSLVATLEAEITYGITGTTWLALPNGSHTLTIRATDGIDTSVRTYTFTKLVESFTITNSTPWKTDTRATRIMVVVTRNIPSGATFKVEVCNNGYDASPTWEDCTDAVKSGLVHVFSNTTKWSTAWGVRVRVTVSRNGATGACYVSAIGGNFE